MAKAVQSKSAGEPDALDSLVDNVLRWRCIGPHRGGRVVAVAGDPVDSNVFYFGACAGGVWKTTDGGTYWQNVSDGFFNTAAVGAIAVADSDPNVIYAGTGESCIRIDVSHGDGVYRSTDAGDTWKHLGLDDTRHIARIRVHPRDPDLVYVAALGHAFGPNEERGVFRSRDGGENWEKVLYVGDKAGTVDLSLDATNPRVLYASMWETRRTFWDMSSGGPDSGIYKSTDGGDTWTALHDNQGMPQGLMGRIGIAASPAKPGRVWALIEAEEGGLFLSDDGGSTWERLSDSADIRGRPWYYSHIFADPQDAETVWSLSFQVWKSTDGGRTFTQVTTPHGDNHDLWIDPRNTQRMVEGNDGGACVSYNGGATWSTIFNQPTSQFYRLAVDNQVPYRVYATQQDNSAVSVPSRSFKGAILWEDCYTVGSSESGHIAVKPDDPNIVYSGAIGSAPGGGGILLRYDHRTGQVRMVTVWPEDYRGCDPGDMKYRFSWTYPIAFSPHDSNTLYVAGNVAFRSTDEGHSWEAISPDLSRNDPEKQKISGGPITKDGGGAEVHCTIYAFVESPHEPGVLWAGTDDGLIHISRNCGQSWNDVTPRELPEWAQVSTIEVSPHDPATAYVAATRYKFDDNRPYLFKTADYGKSWRRITKGIPDHDFTRVIREDPARPGLLYAGTESGAYVSLDDGASWQSLKGNLPAVSIYDLKVKDSDLVAASHGRSFWVLDDLTPLRQFTGEIKRNTVHLFAPRPTYRMLPQVGAIPGGGPGKSYAVSLLGVPGTSVLKKTPQGRRKRFFLDAGQNPPGGVIVAYYLGEKPDGDLTLAFLDTQGKIIKKFSSKTDDDEEEQEKFWEPKAPAQAGMNRFVWNMRYPGPERIPGDDTAKKKTGGPSAAPLAPPGTYRVELSVAGQTYAQSFETRKDPRSSATQEDLEEQFTLLLKIRDRISETRGAVGKIRSVRQQVEQWEGRADGHSEFGAVSEAAKAVSKAAEKLHERLSAVEDELIQVIPAKDTPDNPPVRLSDKLMALPAVVSSTDARPTRGSYDVFEDLSARVESQLQRLQDVIDTDLSDFLDLLRRLDIPPIVP